MHVYFTKYLVVTERHDSQGYDKVAKSDQKRVRTSVEISGNLGTTLARTLQIKLKTESSFIWLIFSKKALEVVLFI